MLSEFDKALSKLRFDDQVQGYAMITKSGKIFVSFQFPDDIFPKVRDSILLYRDSLRLMTIDTDKGIVVMAPIGEHWVLATLFVPELQLGLAIAKTKNVLRILEKSELPPPPEGFDAEAEEAAAVIAQSEPATTSALGDVEVVEAEKEKVIVPQSVPERGPKYREILDMDSEMVWKLKKEFSSMALDVLMLVDNKKTISTISELVFQPADRVIEILKWAEENEIVTIPVVEIPEKEHVLADCPMFEGELRKVKKDDRLILAQCDGTKPAKAIAEELKIPYPLVLSVIAKYNDKIRIIRRMI